MRTWPLIDRLGRRPGSWSEACLSWLQGYRPSAAISTINNAPSLKATVAFMAVWDFFYQPTLGAVAYAIHGETPSPSHRQKTYSINIMSATAVSCAILQVMLYLINPDQANLGGKICFAFFAPSVPICLYLYFCLPEMKGPHLCRAGRVFSEQGPPLGPFVRTSATAQWSFPARSGMPRGPRSRQESLSRKGEGISGVFVHFL
ncbi:hypothetical protein MCOR25_008876 [Pyricularia grisea]|uniref:Uncharacterized protein n=1 Tax=Pyricularia grisea TaxID=148305 RepID=A0A6P8BD87_PYRGI|nr:uncharacterized protein PgNI_04511 [Pyricularia grisea]KAI6353830.1 hypothetical protein MCOR25_008876 [Pyricularia grisea]TLD13724.1 hypothetical protein PgNI_04511 [Pyricularia grisea]